MSETMSETNATPQQPPPRGHRGSGRRTRPQANLDGAIPLTAPLTEHNHNPSPAAGHVTKNNNKGQHRKNSNANPKSHAEGVGSDRPKHGNNHHERTKGTPIKQAAYAGSTFQQSPAASALPLPSFYSKSLPTSVLATQSIVPEPDSPPTSTESTTDGSPSKRESTPCDFLFEAARQARATPRANSPATRSGNLSVPNASPASRSPAPREGDSMFPFELEGGNPGEDGSSFATPYKDRMAALQSTRSTSSGGKSMDENERKAKSEALKKLLMKSSGQENRSSSDSGIEMNNPFNARAPYLQAPSVPHGPPLVRHSSGPTTPVYMQENAGRHSPYHYMPAMPYQFPTPQTQTPKRPNSSRLRNVYGAQSEPEYAELSSDSAITPPISTRKHTAQQVMQSQPIPYPSQPPIPTHRAKPSAQQLEDDLRRVLKLDLVSRG